MLLGAIEAMEASPAPPRSTEARRSPTTTAVTPPSEDPPARPVDELLAELDGLVGLDGVKHEVKLVTNLLRVQKIRARARAACARPEPPPHLHRQPRHREDHRRAAARPDLPRRSAWWSVATWWRRTESGLVAGYVGQTAPLVQARFDEADQGVLLIDEAYSLVRGGERDFGREAIDTIVKLIEDRRDRIVVVMAGYPDEMEELIVVEPGAALSVPEGDPLPRLHHRRAAADHGLARRERRLPARPRRPGPGSHLARLDHARQGVRQRAHRPQPLRARGVHPGHAAGTGRVPHRRAAHHPGGRRHPAAGEGPLTVVRPTTGTV